MDGASTTSPEARDFYRAIFAPLVGDVTSTFTIATDVAPTVIGRRPLPDVAGVPTLNDPKRILNAYRNASYTKVATNRPYNREHIWPKSYGFPDDHGTNYPYSDTHMLRLLPQSPKNTTV